jgi:DNA-binding CsgD family transcriptional regulator
MIDIDGFSQTIAQIYDASLNAERWDVALTSLSGLFDSPMAQLSYFESRSDAHPLFRFTGFDPIALSEEGLRKFRTLSLVDPRWPPTTYKPFHCRQLVSDDTLWSSAIYQQVLAPARVEYSMFVALNVDSDSSCLLSVMRRRGSSTFTADDCVDFGRFVPHVSRAITMHGTLRRARDTAVVVQALIDRVPMGMLVLQDEHIVLTNTEATILLDQGDALRRLGSRLQAATPLGQAQLSRALREARDSSDEPIGVTLPAGDTGQVRGIVRRLDLSAAGRLGARPDAIALYLADSRRPIETRQEVVRRLFGLTEREASVLCALVQGDDTRGIARRLSVGFETVKTHLQHIMHSVGVSRQAELVRLVLSSPAWIADPRPRTKARASRNLPAESPPDE